MGVKNKKAFSRNRIKMRVRKSVIGTAERPRMSVFRSNKQIYVQLIDDASQATLASATSRDKSFEGDVVTKIEQSKKVGNLIATRAKEAGIETVVFDRNGYLYHGRVKSLAEGAREGGLKF